MKLLSTFICLFNLIVGIAQGYDYHPNATLILGNGVNIGNLAGTGTSPLDTSFNTIYEQKKGSFSTYSDQRFIFSEEDLEKTYNLGVNVNARFLGYSASAAFNIAKSEVVNERALTIHLWGETNWGRAYIDPKDLLKLNADATHLIEETKFDMFIQKYGNYIVNMVDKISRLNVYITLNNFDQNLRENLKFNAKGKASGVVDAEVNINSEIKKAYLSGNYRISLLSNGDTSGFPKLRGILAIALENSNPIVIIDSVIKEYTKEFTRESSAIMKYYLIPATSLGIPKVYVKWNNSTEVFLKDIYKKYNKLIRIHDSMDIVNDNVTFINTSSEMDKGKLEKEKKLVSNALENVINVKDRCISSCQNQNISVCCSSDNLETPSTPVFTKYRSLLRKMSFISQGVKYIPINKSTDLLNIDFDNTLLNKRLNLSIRLYSIPVQTDGGNESTYQILNDYPVVNLLINDIMVLSRFTREDSQKSPDVITDNNGKIIGYTTLFKFELEDYTLGDLKKLKISLRYVGTGPSTKNEDKNAPFLKIHPHLVFNSYIGD